jgi:hypothetical protein
MGCQKFVNDACENKRGCFIYVAYVAMITHGSVGLSTDSLQEPMVLCMPLTDGA